MNTIVYLMDGTGPVVFTGKVSWQADLKELTVYVDGNKAATFAPGTWTYVRMVKDASDENSS
jgi:hypothetical protein